MNWGLLVQIATPVLALFLGAILNKIIERRPRLIAFIGHASAHVIRGDGDQVEKELRVFTHSTVLKNNGRLAARNVVVKHGVFPLSFDVYPPTNYQKVTLPDGSIDIVFPVMSPKEEVTLSYLYYPPVTFDKVSKGIKSDEGPVKILSVVSVHPWPKMLSRGIIIFSVWGIVCLLYVIIYALRYVA
jgi:hypothetical protein